MNKQELIKGVAETTEYTKKDVEVVVNEVFAQIANALANGEEVNIPGHGKYSVKERAARTGRNPKTGEEVEIQAKNAPAFKAAKALKDAVNV
ncbi:DNA-binding protein HU 1 [compost metagenome]